MSEFHPNRDTPVKTKLGLTRRKILESWPLLVWVGIGLIAAWGYSRGRVFARMNGAVDVYQENISPIEEGRIAKILVKRGDFVPPNSIIARMDSSLYERELVGVLRGVAANRYEEISRIERQQLRHVVVLGPDWPSAAFLGVAPPSSSTKTASKSSSSVRGRNAPNSLFWRGNALRESLQASTN